ncbi:TrmB family transcriptional regulator [Methanocella arvoryzae]|uniref:Transcription regulator (TrmB family) n=1 Tax=Methanocella arvoryzae (strain DSM 22066 / NBRC 105507 / MRE50) TaxID=351160 RepID=Q0W3Q7_METAR|nr:helix-turn-helix domain-containing protein [Methanocella arvoryzae]CAJ36986.1 putative transcription regulator (TrmB family) [Methanocella arvoryzae MRE50]
MEQHFDEKTLSKLSMFGMTEYESKVYLTLLVKGAQEASKVSRYSGLPRPHTYSVLKTLQMRGLVTVIPESVNRYRAVPLDEGLDLLIEEKEKQFSSLRIARDQLLSEIKPKEAIPDGSHSIVSLYYGRQNVYKLVDEMFQRCEHDVDIMTTSHGIVRFYKYFSDVASQFRRKDIAVRFIAPITPDVEDVAQKLARLVELRRIDTLPPIRFVLVDGKEVLFAEYPEDDFKSTGKETGIWINQPELGRMMKTLFDNTWKTTTAYPELQKTTEKED